MVYCSCKGEVLRLYLSCSFIIPNPNMTEKRKHQIINWLIATVWVINGLLCKVLNLVPRHQQIVSGILGQEYSQQFTLFIGLAEMGMAIWIVSGTWPRLNTIIQILVIATMNTLEFFVARDLLLWGSMNAVFAFLFIIVIYHNEFNLNRKLALQS